MFTAPLYILLPVAFALSHAPAAIARQGVGKGRRLLAALVEVVLSLVAVHLFLYHSVYPLLALFWGFALCHVAGLARSVVRGRPLWHIVVGAFLLLYALAGMADMLLCQLSWRANLALALAGTATLGLLRLTTTDSTRH